MNRTPAEFAGEEGRLEDFILGCEDQGHGLRDASAHHLLYAPASSGQRRGLCPLPLHLPQHPAVLEARRGPSAVPTDDPNSVFAAAAGTRELNFKAHGMRF